MILLLMASVRHLTCVYCVSRDKSLDTIKRGGENVAAGEVESVILQHPKMFDCAVIGVLDPMRDEAIKAFVVLHKDEQSSSEEIIA